jgi:N-acetylneuraminate synthase
VVLKQFCDEVGITYLCTPFSWAAAQELDSAIDMPAYKIGSGEMTDIPSLLRISGLGRPMIISTGMSTFGEIERTYEALISTGVPIALLNCVSEYPPAYEDLNIDVLSEMITRYPQAIIGHSDHTPDIYTCFAAVTLGASLIEKHVILDKAQKGPDQSVSIDFQDLANLIDGIRKIEASRGNVRSVHGREQAIRTWAFRSVVSTQPIPVGTRITQDMVWSKRPGTGIPSHRMDEVIGRTAGRDITANVLLAWEDFA